MEQAIENEYGKTDGYSRLEAFERRFTEHCKRIRKLALMFDKVDKPRANQGSPEENVSNEIVENVSNPLDLDDLEKKFSEEGIGQKRNNKKRKQDDKVENQQQGVRSYSPYLFSSGPTDGIKEWDFCDLFNEKPGN